jgi:predicted secreted protein
MATIKGQNLRLFMENGSGQMSAIAAAQQCQLSLRLEVKQTSTKDDTDDFAKNIALKLSWSVSANGVVTVDPDRNDPASLMNRIGQTVRVELATASGDQNSDMGEQLLAGDAIISDVQIQANNEDESTYSIQLTGKKNMLTDIRLIVTSDDHYIRTADGNLVAAVHEEV